MVNKADPVLLGMGVAASVLLAPLVAEAALPAVSGFDNPGNLTMYKYVPSALAANAPLVVALHGCTQNGEEYLNNAGWKKMADQFRFAVLVPEQKSANNQNKCFNWFEPGDYRRGQGESRSIINAMDKVIADHQLDRSRVYVSGLSAGGAMTSVMLGSYPDRFAGGAVMAGVVYGCASDLWSGLSCMNNPGTDPNALGDAVRNANPGYSGPWPKVQVWHGKNDDKVSIANLSAIVRQWTNVLGTDQNADSTVTLGNATRKSYTRADQVVVESFEVAGMGHSVATDPGNEVDQCGAGVKYYEDANVCASFVVGKFFGIMNDPNDGASSGPTPPPAPGDDCIGRSATWTFNSLHALSGRARSCGTDGIGNPLYCAVGSNEPLGYAGQATMLSQRLAPSGWYDTGTNTCSILNWWFKQWF